VSYLEIAKKALEGVSEPSQSNTRGARRGCEESEKSEKRSPEGQDHDDQVTCRIIERDLGLTPGSLTLWKPIH
jgi:hypothetical protein